MKKVTSFCRRNGRHVYSLAQWTFSKPTQRMHTYSTVQYFSDAVRTVAVIFHFEKQIGMFTGLFSVVLHATSSILCFSAAMLLNFAQYGPCEKVHVLATNACVVLLIWKFIYGIYRVTRTFLISNIEPLLATRKLFHTRFKGGVTRLCRGELDRGISRGAKVFEVCYWNFTKTLSRVLDIQIIKSHHLFENIL